MANMLAGCDNCGAVDDHPKLHYGDETYHHDCIPARVSRDLDMTDHLAAVIDAATAGTHGDDLRTLIGSES